MLVSITCEDQDTPPVFSTGQAVTGPDYIEGTRALTATNDARGDFIVTLWPMRAPWTGFEMPVLEARPGEYGSSFTFDGVGHLHIDSD